MSTASDLFGRLRRGESVERPLFAPLLTGIAARVGRVSADEMYEDPGKWAGSLLAAAELFDLDCVVAGYRPGLMAEVSLASDPIGQPSVCTALETMRRVFHSCGQHRIKAAGITGPLSLDAELAACGAAFEPRDVKRVMVKMTEAVCETRPDMLMVVEDSPGAHALSKVYSRVFRTLHNVSSHYDIPVALYLRGHAALELEGYLGLGYELYVLGPHSESHIPTFDSSLPGGSTLAVGVSLPLGDSTTANRLLEQALELRRSAGCPGLMLSAYEPATGDGPGGEAGESGRLEHRPSPDHLHELMADIDRIGQAVND